MSSKRPSSPGATTSNKRVRQPSINSFFTSSRTASAMDRASPVIIDVDRISDEIPPTSSESLPALVNLSRTISVATITTASDQPRTQYPNLSVDPASFDLDSCFWPTSTQAPYSFLAHVLSALSATRSRIAILNTLTNALRTLLRYHPPSLLPSLYLLSNSLAPSYVPVELGLGPSVISKAIQHVSGITPAALKRLYNQTGDPGDVAFLAKCSVRTLIPHPPLSIQGVYDALRKIAHTRGKGAVTQKQSMVEKLLVAAKGEEIRYLVRTLSQHIRVGAVRTSILTAFARALVLTSPATITNPTPSGFSHIASPKPVAHVSRPSETSRGKGVDIAEALLKQVYVRHPNYDHIVSAILEAGLDGLAERVPLTVGVPLQPTLGSPMRSLDDVYGRVDDLPFTAEFKYDGQRAQIHAKKSDTGKLSVSLFSRHLENMTEKYPDIVSLVQQFFAISRDISSFIVDAEIVAINASGGSLKSFQELSHRARKDVKLHEIKVPVCVYAFDLMYLNGQSLLKEPFRTRRKLLHTHFPAVQTDLPGAAKFEHVESCESEEGREAIEEFWLRSIDSRCEGLMIKLLDYDKYLEGTGPRRDTSRKQSLPSTYEPDKRTSAWLKLKKDYVTGLGDTLDVVPIGAWHGNGRKAQWWSPILLAIRDTRTDRLVAVCKCMSGESASMKDRYSENSTNCSKLPLWGEVEAGGYSPSVYFRPHEVWEIRGADVTLSPVSPAAQGLVSEEKGLSLRFPRFVRVREDKSVDQASSTEFLVGMYRGQQERGQDLGGADEGHLIDPAPSENSMDDDWEDELD
ncbi:ATP-dependent DNA ligase [Russula vinacea]|nr:ATP-dependent DNA ligase [Russula vinacea]